MSRPRRAPLAAAAAFAALAGTSAGQAPTTRPSVEPVVTSLTIFAGTPDTLWRTRDWGSTWEPVNGLNTPEQPRLSEVRVIYPTGPRVYVGGAGGVAVSDDFGITWRRIAETTSVLSLMPSRYPQSDPTLFLGTARGLLKTLDDGRTLLPTAVQNVPVRRLEWPGPALVAATDLGVAVSPDGGQTVQPAGNGLPDGEIRALAVSGFFQVDPVMYVGRSRGLYRSSDGGRTWHPAGLEARDVNDLAWLGPVLYAATDAGVWRSEDQAKTWAAVGEKSLAGRVNRLLFPLMPDSGAVVFAATDHGVYRSEDAGLNWRFSGMQGQDVIAIATFPAPERVMRAKPRR